MLFGLEKQVDDSVIILILVGGVSCITYGIWVLQIQIMSVALVGLVVLYISGGATYHPPPLILLKEILPGYSFSW